MKNSLETRLGLFVALIMLAAFFLLVIVGGVEFFRRGLRVDALFNGVQELKVGDRVKMAGVEIGKVEKITPDYALNKVRVSMKIRKEIKGNPVVVKTDSIATIKSAGLMGQSFVSLDFGIATTQYENDGTTNVIATAEQADMSAIMQQLNSVADGIKDVTKVFAGDSMNNLFSTFSDFMKSNTAPLTASISNLNSVSAEIAAGRGTIGKLVKDDSLYTSATNTLSNLQSGIATLQSTGDEIKLAIADARKIIDDVNAGKGTLGKLVTDEALYREATNSMTNLKEILQKMNSGQGTVGKLINDQEFYKNAKLTLQKIDKATEGLEDQGPLSVLGILVNNLF